ncbi:MAG: Fe-S cluster assembly protein SufD [Bacteroidetes bacterium]|nr:Fe-S cluster assembly protein SufD [Bacteroidota bacterium]
MNTTIGTMPEYLTRYFENNNLIGPASLKQIRKDALARFEALGIPTTKHEEWKYTNLTALTRSEFHPALYHTLSKDVVVNDMIAGKEVILLVFENGRLNKELSSFDNLPKGITVGELGDNFDHPAVVKNLAKHASFENEAMVALNTAHIFDGAFIHVAENVHCEKPIHLLYISGGEENTLAFPRNLMIAEKNSSAKVIESFHSRGNESSFINIVTEVVLEENSNVEWSKIQLENSNTFHISHTECSQSANSNFDIHTITFGGKIVRNNLHIVLNGKNITSNLNGLYVSNGDSLVDNHTLVDHAMPNCLSNELYKGVLDGKSKGVFNGKIFVRKDAQKTNAYQSNKNILMSDEASMNAKPQLEIFADDVKCSHGATTGQLDKEALFYLRSRGIGEEAARAFLTIAFADDVLNRITNETLRDELKNRINERLDKSN